MRVLKEVPVRYPMGITVSTMVLGPRLKYAVTLGLFHQPRLSVNSLEADGGEVSILLLHDVMTACHADMNELGIPYKLFSPS